MTSSYKTNVTIESPTIINNYLSLVSVMMKISIADLIRTQKNISFLKYGFNIKKTGTNMAVVTKNY